jgi:hypothetical protein
MFNKYFNYIVVIKENAAIPFKTTVHPRQSIAGIDKELIVIRVHELPG